MARVSAGILFYRRSRGRLEFLLVHPGGPFWRNRDKGAWSIPKGEALPGEDLQKTAIRETMEETGISVKPPLVALSPVRLKSGKKIFIWAKESELDPESVRSNTVAITWPPRSGKRQYVPEIDRAEWMTFEEACEKINSSYIPALQELLRVAP